MLCFVDTFSLHDAHDDDDADADAIMGHRHTPSPCQVAPTAYNPPLEKNKEKGTSEKHFWPLFHILLVKASYCLVLLFWEKFTLKDVNSSVYALKY